MAVTIVHLLRLGEKISPRRNFIERTYWRSFICQDFCFPIKYNEINSNLKFMLSKTLKNFLDKNKVKYDFLEHRTVYTALDKAATLKVKPTSVGKTVVVSLDGKNFALGLIPANKNLDKQKVLAAFNKLRQKNKEKTHKKINLATEKWMKTNIRGAKLGATPPFGALYKLPFFIDTSLARQPKIIVNAGEYELSLKLSPTSLIKLNPNALKGCYSMAKK